VIGTGGQSLLSVDYRYRIFVIAPEWRVVVRERGGWRWEAFLLSQFVGVLNRPAGLRPAVVRPWEAGLGAGLTLGRGAASGRWMGYLGVGSGFQYVSAPMPRQSSGPAFCSQLFAGMRCRLGRRCRVDLRGGFRHVSNAGMSSPNGGIDNSFLQVGLSRGGMTGCLPNRLSSFLRDGMRLLLESIPPAMRQQWLQHVVAPRPIGLVSTIDAAGRPNLSPFSFFNLFSTEPPVLVFSPARRLRDNTVKHTLANVLAVPECVVHVVDGSIVRQVSLSSCEYPAGVDESVMAGLTAIPSEAVRPPRIAESPVQMECRVTEVKPLGERGGAGNLVICEVLVMHVADRVLNDAGTMVDPQRLRPVARLGGDWYCRVDAASLFEVEKPNQRLGIGFPGLPEDIRHSQILTGDRLARLSNVEALPPVDPAFDDPQVRHIIHYFAHEPAEMERELHRHAAALLDAGRTDAAWQVLLTASHF